MMIQWMKDLIKRNGDRIFCDGYSYNELALISRHYKFPSNKRIVVSEDNSIFLLSKLMAIWSVDSTPVMISPKLDKDLKKECLKMIEVHNERVNDEGMIVFTSGTSSIRPKGVILTHSNLEHHRNMLDNHVSKSFLSGKDRTICILPWTHCYGLMGECFSMMERGGTMKVTGNYFLNVYRHKPTILFVVPKFIEKILHINKNISWLLNKDQKRRYLFGTDIRFLVSGGAYLPSDLMDEFQYEFGIDIYQGYGCSEMSPMICLETRFANMRYMQMIDGVDIKIDHDGEILVRGPSRFYGYLGSPKLDDDTYYFTGDLGKIFQNRLIHCGRKGSLVKLRNGYYIDLDRKEMEILQETESLYVSIWEDNGELKGVVYRPKKNLQRFPYLEKLPLEPTIENGMLTVKRELKRHIMKEIYKVLV